MAARDRDDGALPSGAAFERWLLDSASSDGPARGAAEAAWAQFAQAAGSAAGPQLEAMPRGRGAPRSEAPAPAAGVSAAPWIGLGALGGAIFTALVGVFALRGTLEGEPVRSVSPTESSATASSATAATTASATGANAEAPAPLGAGGRAPERVAQALPPASPEIAAGAADGGASLGVAGRARHLRAAAESRRSRGSSPEGARRSLRAAARSGSAQRAGGVPEPALHIDVAAGPAVRASALEREVAWLDAIRVASASADFGRAIELVARYRHEFEQGELARDADVFEIEALAGEGQKARAAQAANAFLSRYPSDPHTARVRALMSVVRAREIGARSGR